MPSPSNDNTMPADIVRAMEHLPADEAWVNEPHAFSDPLMASFADATSGDAKESFAFDATAPKASTSDVAAVSPTLHAIASKKGAVALALAPDPNAALLAQLAAMQAKLDAVEKKAAVDAEPVWKDANGKGLGQAQLEEDEMMARVTEKSKAKRQKAEVDKYKADKRAANEKKMGEREQMQAMHHAALDPVDGKKKKKFVRTEAEQEALGAEIHAILTAGPGPRDANGQTLQESRADQDATLADAYAREEVRRTKANIRNKAKILKDAKQDEANAALAKLNAAAVVRRSKAADALKLRQKKPSAASKAGHKTSVLDDLGADVPAPLPTDPESDDTLEDTKRKLAYAKADALLESVGTPAKRKKSPAKAAKKANPSKMVRSGVSTDITLSGSNIPKRSSEFFKRTPSKSPSKPAPASEKKRKSAAPDATASAKEQTILDKQLVTSSEYGVVQQERKRKEDATMQRLEKATTANSRKLDHPKKNKADVDPKIHGTKRRLTRSEEDSDDDEAPAPQLLANGKVFDPTPPLRVHFKKNRFVSTEAEEAASGDESDDDDELSDGFIDDGAIDEMEMAAFKATPDPIEMKDEAPKAPIFQRRFRLALSSLLVKARTVVTAENWKPLIGPFLPDNTKPARITSSQVHPNLPGVHTYRAMSMSALDKSSDKKPFFSDRNMRVLEVSGREYVFARRSRTVYIRLKKGKYARRGPAYINKNSFSVYLDLHAPCHTAEAWVVLMMTEAGDEIKLNQATSKMATSIAMFRSCSGKELNIALDRKLMTTMTTNPNVGPVFNELMTMPPEECLLYDSELKFAVPWCPVVEPAAPVPKRLSVSTPKAKRIKKAAPTPSAPELPLKKMSKHKRIKAARAEEDKEELTTTVQAPTTAEAIADVLKAIADVSKATNALAEALMDPSHRTESGKRARPAYEFCDGSGDDEDDEEDETYGAEEEEESADEEATEDDDEEMADAVEADDV